MNRGEWDGSGDKKNISVFHVHWAEVLSSVPLSATMAYLCTGGSWSNQNKWSNPCYENGKSIVKRLWDGEEHKKVRDTNGYEQSDFVKRKKREKEIVSEMRWLIYMLQSLEQNEVSFLSKDRSQKEVPIDNEEEWVAQDSVNVRVQDMTANARSAIRGSDQGDIRREKTEEQRLIYR